MIKHLKFEEGRGPVLNPIQTIQEINALDSDNIDQILSPVYAAVTQVRKKLSNENFDDVTLIGFAGSPWTVACYMIEGGSSKNFAKILDWAKSKPDHLQLLIDKIVAATIHYLSKQIEAGAEVLQLFDSWAGLLDGNNFDRWIIQPNAAIIRQIRQKYPDLPIIGFPRKNGSDLLAYAQNTGISALGLDYSVDPRWAHENLAKDLPVQGNLHPEILLKGGSEMEEATLDILQSFRDRPLIFNLGHGVIKETPPEHVAQLSKMLKEYRV